MLSFKQLLSIEVNTDTYDYGGLTEEPWVQYIQYHSQLINMIQSLTAKAEDCSLLTADAARKDIGVFMDSASL
jgi:hypothetical protein